MLALNFQYVWLLDIYCFLFTYFKVKLITFISFLLFKVELYIMHFKNLKREVVVIHAFNPCTQEAEAGLVYKVTDLQTAGLPHRETLSYKTKKE